MKGGRITFRRWLDTPRILRCHIGTITNMEIEDENGRVKKITNGAELAEAPVFGIGELVTELSNEVISDGLTENEKKLPRRL